MRLKAEVELDDLTNPNLTSFLLLKGEELFIKKGKQDISLDKRDLLEKLVERSSALITNSTVVDLFKNIEEGIGGLGYEHRKVVVETKSRLVVGLSTTFGLLPFEVGLSFDPFTNLPYIPASSIKGATRSAFHELYCEEKGEEKGKEYESVEEEIFGSKNEKGKVNFTDAYPINVSDKYLLYPDIINPHYKDVDNELDVSPKPVVFLTVAPGVKFQFYIYWKDLTSEQRGMMDRSLIYAFLKGVGAKTALGYSVFDILEYTRVTQK